MEVPNTPTIEALRLHEGFLKALAGALLSGGDRADDLVQETYAIALRSGPRDPGALRGWLAGIVRNLARGVLRRDAVHRRSLERAARPTPEPTPGEIVEREEVRRKVVRALLELDELYRRPLLLRFYEGLPHREIARHIGVPLETARTRMKRGLELLRSRLDAEHGGERRTWALLLLPWAGGRTGSGLPGGVGTVSALTAGALAVKKTLTAVVAIAMLTTLYFVFKPGGPAEPPEGPEPPDSPTEWAASAPPPASGSPEARSRPATAGEPVVETGSTPVRPVYGAVSDEEGRAVPNVAVLAIPADAEPVKGRSLRAVPGRLRLAVEGPEVAAARATSDVAGRFELSVPSGGDLVLVVSDPLWISDPVALPHDEEQARLTVRRGASLTVNLTDPDGNPVTRGAVMISWAASEEDRSDPLSETDDSWIGQLPFKAAPLDPGEWRIDGAISLLDPGLAMTQRRFVTLSPGEERIVELRLHPVDLAPSGESVAWVVKLEDEAGKPLTGAVLERWMAGSPQVRITVNGQSGITAIGGDGTIRFLVPHESPVALEFLSWSGSVTSKLDLPAGGGEATHRLPFRASGASLVLEGKVLDSAGVPVADAYVSVSDGELLQVETRTDEAGVFRAENLFPGHGWVTVVLEDGTIHTEEVQDLTVGRLAITVPRSGRIEVRVRAADGEFSAARVNLHGRGAREGTTWAVYLSAAGSGSAVVPPGDYDVSIAVPTSDGGWLAVRRIAIASGEETGIDIRLRELAEITLVSGGAGAPEKIRVQALDGDGGPLASIELAARSPLRLRFPPRTAELLVSGDGRIDLRIDPAVGETELLWGSPPGKEK